MSVNRCYSEKKPGFDVEARSLFSSLHDLLEIKSLTHVRYLCRYDTEGLAPEAYEKAKGIVFSEPMADVCYDEDFPRPAGAHTVLAVEPLPGQFDQRADSCAQCIQLLTGGERPAVAAAKIYVLEGALSDADLDKIRGYLINPVESREASMDKPATLKVEYAIPTTVASVTGFIHMDEAALSDLLANMGLAMDLDDLKFLQAYFRDEEKRDPTITEVRMVDTYWSDHCRHTTFLTEIDGVKIDDPMVQDAFDRYLAARVEVYGEEKAAKRPVTLMDIATAGAKVLKKRGYLKNIDESEEINACSIKVKALVNGHYEDWLLMFKNETHNHPTEIEPFGGAATCLGGAIRDPLSGRSYVYQAMRVTGAGDPTVPLSETLEHKLPQRKLCQTAAAGYSSYGNQIGLATGLVHEIYHPGYVAKRMEIGAVVGAAPIENVIREVPEAGDVVILLGGKTGRDGCGGATGSSKKHTEASLETCGAEVQKGNPPEERKIQRLFRDGNVTRMIRRCNDFGAGGVSVAIGELADGLDIDLNAVPKKYDGLDGTELAISESQERMAVVLAPGDVDAFIAAADRENLNAQVVAVVTAEPRLRMQWRDDTIVDIARAFLDTNGVTQNAEAVIEAPNPDEYYRDLVPECLQNKPLAEAFSDNLKRLEVCSQKGLVERFDASIGAASVLMPFAGKYQLTPEDAMVAKLPVIHGETDDATAMSYGYIPGIAKFSPFHGAAYAVVESLSKLCAVGADPMKARLTFQEYFERLRDVPTRWGKPAAALLGALTAQLKLGLPSIGGKDSMSGSFEELDVPPTLVSFAITMTKASKTATAALQQAGSQVVLFKLPENKETLLPDWDALPRYYETILTMMENGEILSASVVKEGGVAAAVAKMAFGNKIGISFDRNMEDAKALFAPISGSIVAELRPGTAFPKEAVAVGVTVEEPVMVLGGASMNIDDLIAVWSGKLEKIFPSFAPEVEVEKDVPLFTERYTGSPVIKTAKPKVFIPVFPGTNCEYDTARAFEKAGADPHVLVVRNLTADAIEETIVAMEKAIKESQIIMLPGGFSGGDEPDGSGKFIATTFRNPRIAQAVTDLLEARDGLMLGICNGFQALIKLGLVPFGKITEPSEDAPTLTFNTLGRHVSRMVYTRVTSVKSPWFAGVNAGDVFAIPVSHGEGRFVANNEYLEKLIANGQVATQYVTPCGKPSGSIEWNPNGSVCAIEGITSPDGRVLGKMGHSERKGSNLYGNVPGEKDQKIFESGVAYFK